jgi:hypothetical protein
VRGAAGSGLALTRDAGTFDIHTLILGKAMTGHAAFAN